MLYEIFAYKLLDKISVRYPNIYYNLCKAINSLVRKDKNTILFIPHQNCKNDNYDLFNTVSDNVLALLISIIHDPNYKYKNLHVVYYHRERLLDYQSYCNVHYSGNVDFIYYEDYYQNLRAFFKSVLIFVDNFYLFFPYKNKKQKVICLGYYAAPFKDDYYKIAELHDKINEHRKLVEKSYDYHVCTSDMSSRLISLDSLIPFSRFLALGMPRNDVFYRDNTKTRNNLLKELSIDAQYIFIYVPTHRDYESERRIFFDEKDVKKRSIWGFEPDVEIEKLEDVLEKNNAVVIVKVHPDQAKSVLDNKKKSRVLFYSDIVKQIPTSLNEMMAISDFMISDYTTAAYDFMCADRPIIYYCYDIEKYTNTRGFSINPITPLCPGDFAYNLQELRKAMVNVMNGNDNHKEQRHFVTDLIMKYKDGNSTQRIKEYFLGENRNI